MQIASALIGWALGADVGVGTLLVVLLIGPVVDWMSRAIFRDDTGATSDGTCRDSSEAAQARQSQSSSADRSLCGPAFAVGANGCLNVKAYAVGPCSRRAVDPSLGFGNRGTVAGRHPPQRGV